MTTKLSNEKKKLIQRFHIALKQAGMAKQKEAMLEELGVESTRDLAEAELEQMIAALTGSGDKWRKRVMAAIFAWCRAISYEADTATVKGIACKASGYKRFNDIPVSRLRDVYYEFVRKSKTTASVREFKQQVINKLEVCN